MNWPARFVPQDLLVDESADYMQGTRMAFNTKEDAIVFAEKQGYNHYDLVSDILGWEYYIQEPHNRQFKPKAYAANFNYCIKTPPAEKMLT